MGDDCSIVSVVAENMAQTTFIVLHWIYYLKFMRLGIRVTFPADCHFGDILCNDGQQKHRQVSKGNDNQRDFKHA